MSKENEQTTFVRKMKKIPLQTADCPNCKTTFVHKFITEVISCNFCGYKKKIVKEGIK